MSAGEIILYEIHPSYYSQMARMALVERNVPYTKKPVNILAGENYEPEYVKINPACEIPAMSVGGRIINGSQPIMEYVAQHFGKKSEQHEKEVQELRRRCFELPITEATFALIWYPEISDPNYKMPDAIRGVYETYLRAREDGVRANMDKCPELKSHYEAKLASMKSLGNLKNDKQKLAASYQQVEKFLDDLENILEKFHDKSWLVGSDFTDADIMAAVLLARLELLGLHDKLISPRKNLAEYYRRVKQRPSFQQECVASM